ncbi:hypothetical protein ABVK25_002506 [Lepraria finkii]|uniref:Uncharacterized protein n=1 Tax=Lepraria finkii TaxID=1340010 RepID=A0ABR4BIH5_9LECA
MHGAAACWEVEHIPTGSEIRVSMSIAIKRRASGYAPRILELVSDIEISDTVFGEVFPSTFTRLLPQFSPTFVSCIVEFKNLPDSAEIEFVSFWGKLDTPSTNRAAEFEGEVSLVMETEFEEAVVVDAIGGGDGFSCEVAL